MARTVRALLIAFVALFFITPAAAQQPRRIVAVGDLHGDYAAWLDIARNAGVIDARGHWAGGKTTLVQLGDIVDREPDSLQIIRSLQQLQKEAHHAGGKVVVLLGNHEAMNLLGDYRYTTPGEFAAFADKDSASRRDRVYEVNQPKIEAAARATNPALTAQQIRDVWMSQHPLGWIEHSLAWSPSGELGQWASRNPAVVKINGTLFVHGGISVEYAHWSIDEINRRVGAAMSVADDSNASILNDPLGPLWYRGLIATDPEAEAVRAARKAKHPTPELELDDVLTAYGAKRMVIGHTPDLKGIEIIGGGRLVRIDTGNSRFYGGPLSWLEILGPNLTPHSVARSTR
jgi:hypothetical protein